MGSIPITRSPLCINTLSLARGKSKNAPTIAWPYPAVILAESKPAFAAVRRLARGRTAIIASPVSRTVHTGRRLSGHKEARREIGRQVAGLDHCECRGDGDKLSEASEPGGISDSFLFNLKSGFASIIKGIKPLNRKAWGVTAGDVIAVSLSGKRSQGRCNDDTTAALQMREARREQHGDNSHGLYQRNQPHQLGL